MAIGSSDMPTVKKLLRFGDSTGVVLDPEMLRQVDVEAGSEVEVTLEGGAIVIRPRRYADDDNARAASRKVIRNRRNLLGRLSK